MTAIISSVGVKAEYVSLGRQSLCCEVQSKGKTRSRAEKKGKAGGDAYVIIVFSLASPAPRVLESPLLDLEARGFVIALFGGANGTP